MAVIIDGKKVSNEIKEDIKNRTAKLYAEKGIKPGIALLRVGEDPASKVYVNMKIKTCEYLDFYSVNEILPETATEQEILNKIDEWNNDELIHGILVQLPLPKHISEYNVINKISPDKDADGFHPVSLGKLMIGLPGYVPCTPAGVVELLKYYNIETKGKHIVMVGRSNIVGKPLANLLYQKYNDTNGIVTIVHSYADDISKYTKQADVLISAVGKPNFINGKDVKEGVVALDVGINSVDAPDTKKGYYITGDLNFEEIEPKAYAITPVPGGVGPMTIAMLMKNTYLSAEKSVENK
jgi:methylenetetrahydrofolate dehydrogenase (NADP+)/methenyltetrahydrofolate cyclohydrolase